ncbi:N-acetylglucosaminidase [Pontibacillus salipaludis]|uniref:N-acetylglucosaminidase n=1 Tax=Pontibacillus salipaludis TaxID=1697394 RepID=UPI0031E87923
MRKGMMWVFSLVFLLTLLGTTEVAKAESIWEEWEEVINIPSDKVWTIVFDTEIKQKSITEENIYVENLSTGERHPVELKPSEDQKTIEVHPAKGYVVGDSYRLYVNQGLRSEKGNKMMETSIKKTFHVSKEYQIAQMNAIDSYTYGISFDSLEEAKNKARKDGTEVIFRSGEVIWIPEGQSYTKNYTLLYPDERLKDRTAVNYVSGGSEVEYMETSPNGALKVRLSGDVLYAKPSDIQLVPTPFITSQSYYVNKGGELYHKLRSYYGQYLYGKAPEWMDEGEKIFKPDGSWTLGKEDTPLFNYLSLLTKSDYTAEELDQYMNDYSPINNSVLFGHGESFIKAQEKYGVNALYLMAHAIHESGWGNSSIARDKNNLYGLNATDDNPYGNAFEFNSIEDNIMFAAQFVKDGYLTGTGFRANGDYLGNKGEGMNVKYASDPYWGQKIAGHMYRADNALGNKDLNLLTGEPDPIEEEDSETTEEQADKDATQESQVDGENSK